MSRDPKWLVPCYIPGLTPVHSNLFFFFFFRGTLRHMGSWFPNEESNQHSLSWKCGVLNTGKSQIFLKREKGKH